MSPNTRKRKSLIASKVTKQIQEYGLSKVDQVEVLTPSLKQLGIYDQIRFVRKPSKAGRSLTPFETRQAVWDYWHLNSQESTNTTNLAKLRHSDKSHIQSGLDFVPTVSVIRQRNRLFYQGIIKTVQLTYKELYVKYIQTHDEQNHVSWGTFLALRPFYIKPNTMKEIEMCCCKLHLHARWSIKAFIDCCKLQKFDIGEITSYETFFEHLISDCPRDEHTYVSWECSPDRETLCENIKTKWKDLKDLEEKSNPNATVPLMYFEKQLYITKKGKQSERLKALKKHVDLKFLITFIDKLLPKIVYHRNMLQHYRKTNQLFTESLNAVYIDVDFSENLTVPVKYEPQSLHWAHEQVTVHSGLLKVNGSKSYHPYFSDTKVHDHVFVKLAIDEIVSEVPNITVYDAIVIESDNCRAQYKWAKHFNDLQSLANKLGKTVIRIYGIAGHGKGEVCGLC